MLAKLEIPVPDTGFRYRTLPGGGHAAYHLDWHGLAGTGDTEHEARLRLMEGIEQELMAMLAPRLSYEPMADHN